MAYGGTAAVDVKGLADLNRAFARADKKLKTEWRKELRTIGEPTRRSAESKAAVKVRRMDRSPGWAGMRVGITRREVYVAPKKRGQKRGLRKRPNLAPLLMERAMIPALEEHQTQIVGDVDKLLATVGREWER
jgi:hypothetical protein